ncbi:class I SAM-dependent methyltransferase [Methylobacterium haplocladii]|uniref:Methyltransferase domain-containing protein n=1 Tax=Methylobacterium haplocladii TaxID=1176176 RepID=A0A512IPR6_9HYPH|nr:class I SAM-dependent methyltransferase [Methylobacterium haplocladii]GEO99675.1 hypothetical protein MHA02_20630 [Methylobacterium haplocladii]GJD83369.1 tRNA U34 carboxymethyltransferase [Methylobacterium haplocladii]GLS60698.1 hypothetical protein GCM10007887_33820 [Methylobacterium haplocladii]
MKRRFLTNEPSHRNAYDLFEGRWASDLSEIEPSLPAAGFAGFRQDGRPLEAAAHLGRGGRFDGYDVLELGPLEGAHTYQLEGLGARSITAVESNSDAFLKSLIVKNMVGLNRSTFLLGDVSRYLEAPGPRYDVIFCCGILYHMLDPVELIRLAAARSDRLFIWTHYFLDQPRLPAMTMREVRHGSLTVRLHELTYRHRGLGQFLGGNQPKTRWMELPEILAALHHFGLSETTVIRDDPNGPNGPAVTLAASRPGAAPPSA